MSSSDQDADGGYHDVREGRSAEEQLRIDLLNTFYRAFRQGVSEDEVDEMISEAKTAAKEDANV